MDIHQPAFLFSLAHALSRRKNDRGQ